MDQSNEWIGLKFFHLYVPDATEEKAVKLSVNE